jgi:hypothetical protein
MYYNQESHQFVYLQVRVASFCVILNYGDFVSSLCPVLLSDSGWGPVAGSCEYSNEPLDSSKDKEFFG